MIKSANLSKNAKSEAAGCKASTAKVEGGATGDAGDAGARVHIDRGGEKDIGAGAIGVEGSLGSSALYSRLS